MGHFRALRGVALGAILMLGAGTAAPAATYIGEPVPSPSPTPTPIPADGEDDLHWVDRLLQLIDTLCLFLGCAEAQNSGGPPLHDAINRLSVTAMRGGVPAMTDKERADAMRTALDAAVVADAHEGQMNPSDYSNLSTTLDFIVAELASGRPIP